MKAVGLILLAGALGGCSRHSAPERESPTGPRAGLERAAIAAGVIPDPDSTDPTGLYARETDRLCVVPASQDFRIGAFIDYGDGQACSGSGTAQVAGETLHVRFTGADGCAFDARFEGDRIVFPGKLPDACAALCSRRASFDALEVGQLSNSLSEASSLRDPKGKLLCDPGG